MTAPWSLLTKYGTLSVLILFFSLPTMAQFDLALAGSARSYPVGGTVNVKSGYGVLLWGQNKGQENSKNPWYGYLRPAIELDTAGTYNSGSAYLEFFPLAILGARAGGTIAQNQRPYIDFDCEVYQCEGEFLSHFVEGQLALGAGPVFLLTRYRVDQWTHKEGEQDFIEIDSGLAAQADGDELISVKTIAGLQLSPQWSVAIMQAYSEMRELRGIQKFGALAILRNWQNWQLVIGAGGFESSLKPLQATAFARLSWTLVPSVSL